MLPDEAITLDCPNCKQPLTQPLGWFKQTYFTCPHCASGLAGSQFERQVADIETALDENIDEMLQGKPGCGCGGGGCGGH